MAKRTTSKSAKKEKANTGTEIGAFGATKQKQRVTSGSRSEEWWMNNIDYYINNGEHYYTRKDKFLTLYRVAQGIMEEHWYHYVTNPYNAQKEQEKKWPAKIRNYDIISPVLNLLKGEKALRPFPYQVFVHNSDAETIKKEQEKQAINENLIQQWLFQLQQEGFEVGGPEEMPPPPDKVLDEFRKSWSDARAKMGQAGLKFILDDQEVIKKWRKGFYDWMVTDYVFTYKDVIRDNIDYEIVNPYDLSYIASPDTEYVEDGEAAIRRQWMTISEVIDRFYDVLSPEEIAELEESQRNESPSFTVDSQIQGQSLPRDWRGSMVQVYHVVWKSMRKIGKVSTTDVFGNPIEFEVDEDFKPMRGEEVEWMWVNEVVEGYRIDDKYYKEMRPIPYQRGTFDNPSKCKLPYNGACQSTRHTESVSLLEKMIPYQILYNIVKYRLELTMAKNKDKITMLPIGVVPNKEGWDEFTMMYYADSTGYMFFDETNKNSLAAMQYIKTLDAGLNQYIQYIYKYLQDIKQELEEFVGITRQRKGQTAPSEGARVTEQSIFQSSVVTEDLFMTYEEFQRRELQGLLDISRFAWIKGKRSQYVGDDMKLQFLNIEPGSYQEAEFGVFVKTSKKENEKLEALRQMAQAFAQNQMRPSMVADILNSENFMELRDKLEQLEELEMQLQQQQAQSEGSGEQARLQAEALEKQKQRDHESIENEKDRNLEREKMLNETNRELLTADENDNSIPDALEVQKLTQEQLRDQQASTRENKKLDIEKEKNDIKREEIKSKERIEKKKAETALKNPVPGEKGSKK